MHRKRFDWYKSVSISMVVIGVGFFLFSLVFSGILFPRKKAFNEIPEVNTVSSFHATSDTNGTVIQGNRKPQLTWESEEVRPLRNERPVLENLEGDLKELAGALDLPSTLYSFQNRASSESEDLDSSLIDAEVHTLETEIIELLFEYKHAIDQLKILDNEPHSDSHVVYSYIVARRETGDQIMYKIRITNRMVGAGGRTGQNRNPSRHRRID